MDIRRVQQESDGLFPAWRTGRELTQTRTCHRAVQKSKTLGTGLDLETARFSEGDQVRSRGAPAKK